MSAVQLLRGCPACNQKQSFTEMFTIDVLTSFAKFIGKYMYHKNSGQMSSCKYCDVQLYRQFRGFWITQGIQHRSLLLVPEYLSCVTVPFQSNPFNSSYLSGKLFFKITILLNSYFLEQVFFITPTYRISNQRGVL